MQNIPINSRRGDTYDGMIIGIVVNGSALDLTNAQISMEAKVNGASSPSLLLNNASGITILSPAVSGFFQIDPIIFPMDAGVYIYDTSITVGSRVKTYIQGTISIYMDAHYG